MSKFSGNLLFAASPLLSAALAFVVVPLLTWTMPATTIARLGLFQYASGIMLIVVTLGLDQAFLRAISTSRAPSALLRTCLIPSGTLLVAIGALAYTVSAAGYAANLFGSDAGWIVPMLWMNVLLLTIHRYGAQETRMDPGGGAAYFTAELLLRLPLLVLLCLVTALRIPAPQQWLFVAVVLSTALAAAVLVFRNRKTWFEMRLLETRNDGQTMSQLLAFGVPLGLAGALYWAMTNIGVYLTQWVHGPDSTAQMVVATSVASVASIGQAIFSLIWLPFVYRKLDSGLRPRAIALAARRTCVGAAMGFVLVVLALQGAQHLLGVQFRNIAPLAASLCVLPCLYCVSEVTMVGLMAERRSGAALCATALGLSASLIANLLLTIPLGSQGACIATAIAALAFLAARTELTNRKWRAFRRRSVYVGAFSITFAGGTAPLFPSATGPVTLLLVIPYIWSERKIVFGLLRSLIDALGRKSLVQS